MTSLRNQVIMCVFDERYSSPKKITKYLNANKNAVASLLYRLRQEGIAESSGYGRYCLTEKGKALAGKLFGQSCGKPCG